MIVFALSSYPCPADGAEEGGGRKSEAPVQRTKASCFEIVVAHLPFKLAVEIAMRLNAWRIVREKLLLSLGLSVRPTKTIEPRSEMNSADRARFFWAQRWRFKVSCSFNPSMRARNALDVSVDIFVFFPNELCMFADMPLPIGDASTQGRRVDVRRPL